MCAAAAAAAEPARALRERAGLAAAAAGRRRSRAGAELPKPLPGPGLGRCVARSLEKLAGLGLIATGTAGASSQLAPAWPRPGVVGHGALEAVRAVAHPLQGAARQPPGDLGLGAGVRPGADPPRWSPALPAPQQPPGALHQPEGDQPEAADVPVSLFEEHKDIPHGLL